MQLSHLRECEVTHVKHVWHKSNILERVSLYGLGFVSNFFAAGFAVTRLAFTVEVLRRLVLLIFQRHFYRSSWWIKSFKYLFQHRGSTVFVLSDIFRTMSGSL